MNYIFAEEFTPFKKGEILSDTDPRLGDSSDPKAISSPESILKHLQKLTEFTGLKPVSVNAKSKK